MGTDNLFLGIQIQHTPTGLFLYQAHYAKEILHSSGLDSPINTLISLKDSRLTTNQSLYENPTFYRQIAGSLQYLTVTRPDIALRHQSGQLTLTTYADADWASSIKDRKSITGFCTYLGPNLILWSVKKQTTVAKSSTEAEYRALAATTSDVIWLRRLLHDFHAPQSQPTAIFCYNISAIALGNNPTFHVRTKHIEIDHHFISDHI
ncbi:uncharacterized protein LOC110107798 [Dendrobium catenatum]|uniref:uncharacterized protein LOC110107798 n=1 Tax=Dendrobium catenatum TaxID=906689 RepID=UPI0009F4F638|nr:uncharacterized protein LOC110107798 [Dendrobium catenatum]